MTGRLLEKKNTRGLGNMVKPHLYKNMGKKLAGHGGAHLWSLLLGRLRQENCLNPGGGDCGKPRSPHCTPAWAILSETPSQKNKQSKKPH